MSAGAGAAHASSGGAGDLRDQPILLEELRPSPWPPSWPGRGNKTLVCEGHPHTPGKRAAPLCSLLLAAPRDRRATGPGPQSARSALVEDCYGIDFYYEAIFGEAADFEEGVGRVFAVFAD